MRNFVKREHAPRPSRGVSLLSLYSDALEYMYHMCMVWFTIIHLIPQIHVLEDGSVQVYSRNSENNTSKYPDIIARMPKVHTFNNLFPPNNVILFPGTQG